MVACGSSIRLNRHTWMTFNIYTFAPAPSKNPKEMSIHKLAQSQYGCFGTDVFSFRIIPMACGVKEGLAKS